MHPLQSDITGIRSVPINGGISSLQDFSSRSNNNGKGIVVFRVDTPHPKQGIGYHINTVEGKSLKKGMYLPSDIQKININKWNHVEITKGAYDFLMDFDGKAKTIRIKSGKVFAVMGLLLDALELGQAIMIDKTDADKKTWENNGVCYHQYWRKLGAWFDRRKRRRGIGCHHRNGDFSGEMISI